MSSESEGFRGVRAVRDAIPTRRHAEMLFEMVAEALGDEAWVETWNDGGIRKLFRRESDEPSLIVPWPVISITRGGREGPSPLPTAVPGVYEEPPRRPGRAPRIRDLGPGELEVFDGPDRATVTYGADGRWFECSRSASPDALSGVATALEAGNANPVELVAEHLIALDPGRAGSGRVRLPVPLPGGARGVWLCGLQAVREELFNEAGPGEPCSMAADGWTGRARARGETREDALDACRAEIDRVRPFPPVPAPPQKPPPETRIEHETREDGVAFRGTLRGPSSDVPPVEPTVDNSPCAVVRANGRREDPTPHGRWIRLVGAFGTVRAAALRREPEGFTLVGDLLLDRFDPDELRDLLDAADRKAPDRPALPADWRQDDRDLDARLRTYRLFDEATGEPVPPAVASAFWTRRFSPRNLNGDILRRSAVRLRRLEP